ncbi:hypothetical protein FQN51_001513 [Onygenales sp. PD_10]|nr:hypothetical protein FQN51_001513 [Onygenales sp. PD_10]
MSQHGHKPYWSEQERKRLKALRKQQQSSKVSTSEAQFPSNEYWDSYLTTLDCERQIEKLQWEGEARAHSPGDPDYRQAEQAYTLRREELDQRYESAQRNATRYKKRSIVLSLAKTNNDTSLRHAYFQLFIDVLDKTSCSDQHDFVKDLRIAYGTKSSEGAGIKQVWNVFAGDWIHSCLTRAKHIFPHQFGKHTLVYIFGQDAKGELNSEENGLFMPSCIAGEFDEHQLVIVPDGLPQKETRDLYGYGSPTYGELHGRKLVFHDHNQPRARYFYFHYLVTIFRLYREGLKTGLRRFKLSEAGLAELIEAWDGYEGSYVRENVVRAFAEELGDRIPQEVRRRLLRNSLDGITPDEAERLARSLERMELESDEEEEEADKFSEGSYNSELPRITALLRDGRGVLGRREIEVRVKKDDVKAENEVKDKGLKRTRDDDDTANMEDIPWHQESNADNDCQSHKKPAYEDQDNDNKEGLASCTVFRIRDNMLRAFVEEIADDIPEEEGENILQHSARDIPGEEPEILASSVEEMDLESDEEEEEYESV